MLIRLLPKQMQLLIQACISVRWGTELLRVYSLDVNNSVLYSGINTQERWEMIFDYKDFVFDNFCLSEDFDTSLKRRDIARHLLKVILDVSWEFQCSKGL